MIWEEIYIRNDIKSDQKPSSVGYKFNHLDTKLTIFNAFHNLIVACKRLPTKIEMLSNIPMLVMFYKQQKKAMGRLQKWLNLWPSGWIYVRRRYFFGKKFCLAFCSHNIDAGDGLCVGECKNWCVLCLGTSNHERLRGWTGTRTGSSANADAVVVADVGCR